LRARNPLRSSIPEGVLESKKSAKVIYGIDDPLADFLLSKTPSGIDDLS
jgi:hypothetical protein